MARTLVPKVFDQAKSDIEHYSGAGSPIDAVLAGWNPSDRVEFARWYRDEQKAQRAESIKRQSTPPGMHPDMYIRHLAAIDFRNTASLINFIHRTQIRDREPYPRPIVLGSEDGNVYQLRSQLLDMEPSHDLPADTPSSEAIIEIRSTNPNTECNLRFVLPLGTLEYTRIADSLRVETPFHVCVNPVDRSIWLVLSSYTLDDVGDRMPIPRDTDPWPYLGLSSSGRMKFDVMELMTIKELHTLQNQDKALKKDMFGPAIEAVQVWPTAWVPAKMKVADLVPRTTLGPEPTNDD